MSCTHRSLLRARVEGGAPQLRCARAPDGRADLSDAVDADPRLVRGRDRRARRAPLILRSDELQLSRGETVRDTALVLSRHVAAIGIRTGPDELVHQFAEHASVPVINMLTAGHHPCQALADLLTLREAFGRLEGLTLAYVGDGNNVARSLAIVGSLAGVKVRVASPPASSSSPWAGQSCSTIPPRRWRAPTPSIPMCG